MPIPGRIAENAEARSFSFKPAVAEGTSPYNGVRRGVTHDLGGGNRPELAIKSVIFRREVIDSILTYSRAAYPKEGILVLRGSTRKGVVSVESVVIPPLATHGEGFSSFNWNMLPIDLSFLGVAHSHPSGYAVPSHQDLLHVMGRIMVISGHPFTDQNHVKVYNARGEPLPFQVVEGTSKQELGISRDEDQEPG